LIKTIGPVYKIHVANWTRVENTRGQYKIHAANWPCVKNTGGQFAACKNTRGQL
jgi:hypothetical protein